MWIWTSWQNHSEVICNSVCQSHTPFESDYFICSFFRFPEIALDKSGVQEGEEMGHGLTKHGLYKQSRFIDFTGWPHTAEGSWYVSENDHSYSEKLKAFVKEQVPFLENIPYLIQMNYLLPENSTLTVQMLSAVLVVNSVSQVGSDFMETWHSKRTLKMS